MSLNIIKTKTENQMKYLYILIKSYSEKKVYKDFVNNQFSDYKLTEKLFKENLKKTQKEVITNIKNKFGVESMNDLTIIDYEKLISILLKNT